MVGQTNLLDRISGQIERDKFPRFSIFIGEKGSGKRTLATAVAQMMGHPAWIAPDVKVDTIRSIIETCYKADLPIFYVIPDCDNMSLAAANALLKVTEEPPKHAYFILTCENEDNLLSTIRSRGVTYMLEPYSYEEKCDYVNQAYDMTKWSEKETEFALDTATNPGDIDYLWSTDLPGFIEYVTLVIDNIAEVEGSNAFKISEKIALKGEEDKYSLRLFWKMFNSICVSKMRSAEDPLKYARAIAVTGDYAQQLNIRGINQQMLFDNWILSIREEWL